MIRKSDVESLEMLINMPLTEGERIVLAGLVAGQDLVQGTPGGWWQEDQRIDARIGWRLLRRCAISESQFSSQALRYYEINETGRTLIAGNIVKLS